jgi:hypothetical protein
VTLCGPKADRFRCRGRALKKLLSMRLDGDGRCCSKGEQGTYCRTCGASKLNETRRLGR